MGPGALPQSIVNATNAYFLHDLVFSHDGSYIAATTDRGPTYLKIFDRQGVLQWEIELEQRSGMLFENFEAFGFAALASHPSRDTIALGRNDGSINADRLGQFINSQFTLIEPSRLDQRAVLHNRPDLTGKRLFIGSSEALSFFNRKYIVRLVKAGVIPQSIPPYTAENAFLQRMGESEKSIFNSVYSLQGDSYIRRPNSGKTDVYTLMAVQPFADYISSFAGNRVPPPVPSVTLENLSENTARLSVAFDESQPQCKEIEVRVNGSPILDRLNQGIFKINDTDADQISLHFDVPLTIGKNTIEVTAIGSSGIASHPVRLMVDNHLKKLSDQRKLSKYSLPPVRIRRRSNCKQLSVLVISQ